MKEAKVHILPNKGTFFWSLKLNKKYQAKWFWPRDRIFDLHIELVTADRITNSRSNIRSRDTKSICRLNIRYWDTVLIRSAGKIEVIFDAFLWK